MSDDNVDSTLWVANTQYKKGVVVSYDGKKYKAKKQHTSSLTPDTDTEHWTEQG